jgi:hypothetical protein
MTMQEKYTWGGDNYTTRPVEKNPKSFDVFKNNEDENILRIQSNRTGSLWTVYRYNRPLCVHQEPDHRAS